MIRNIGGLLMAVGVLVSLVAFTMDTTVYSSGTFIGGQMIGGGSSYNLGLLQQQMMVLHTGLASFIAGAFLFGSNQDSSSDAPRTSAEIEFEIEDERRRIRVGVIVLAIIGVLLLLLVLMMGRQNNADNNMSVENFEVGNLVVENDMYVIDMNDVR
jgi:hypothetical protein